MLAFVVHHVSISRLEWMEEFSSVVGLWGGLFFENEGSTLMITIVLSHLLLFRHMPAHSTSLPLVVCW